MLQIKTNLCFCLQNAVIVALSSKSWDVETATELLLSNWILTPFVFLLIHMSVFNRTHPLSSKLLLSEGESRSSLSSVFTPDTFPFFSSLSSPCDISSVPSAVSYSNHLLCQLLPLVSLRPPNIPLSDTISNRHPLWNKIETKPYPHLSLCPSFLTLSKKRLSAAYPCLCSAFIFHSC